MKTDPERHDYEEPLPLSHVLSMLEPPIIDLFTDHDGISRGRDLSIVGVEGVPGL